MEKSRSKSWVGNIYHKFEVVCQEVDEFVTKDTVKYVENQVQTVGANMKKFYSGVVPDFLIPVDSHVKKEAQAVNEKPKHAIGTHTSSVANTTQNPIQEKSCQNQNSLERHAASTSTELDGVVASEESEIDLSVGNECATAICKNSCKVFKEYIIREEALVVDEPSTSEDRVPSESRADKDSKDTMCYSFSDDDKCFSDVSSSQSILQDDMVGEEQPSFLDILSLSQLTASMNEKMFDSSPDAINCISNLPSSQMVLQRNITREVEPVADQSNSFGEMALSKSLPFSMEESRGNSTMTKLRHPTSNYDTELRTFPEDESISNASITPTNLQDNITSEDQLASKESSSVEDKTLPQTPAFASVIPPSRNDAGFGVSITVNKSFLGDVTFVFEESSTTLALEDAPSTLQSSELVLSRVMENKSMDVDSGISNCSLLKESSSLSTSSIGNCMQEAESDLSISTGHSSALSTSLVSANNVVSVIPAIPALSSTLLTDFSEVNASSSHELVGNGRSVQNDLECCPSSQLICPAEIGCMNDSPIDLPGMETIDLTDKEMPKESCALVDYKLHHLVSSRPRKYKSYKELIQEAFAPRNRRIKEYEQLAVLYADVDAETSQHVELSQLPSLPSPCLHSTESSTCNICEPEWELL
ncbi:hypothetical protein R3W88_020602 [Solanum pinnatisectum]|uniref:Uncharacterized protein n=1 Tax=Solanum pinnatisectum TaxID=50273 RepID=A0AAV9KQM6_9SOLN|nr:hypothetical protein R3W88_020602 [Solanum pinnatisectum]